MCLVTQEPPQMSSERIKVYKLVSKKVDNQYYAPCAGCLFEDFPILTSKDEAKIMHFDNKNVPTMNAFDVVERGFIHAVTKLEDLFYLHMYSQYCEIWEGYIPENTLFVTQGNVNKMFLGDMHKPLREMFDYSHIAATKIVLTNKVLDNDEIQEKITKIRSSR